MRRFLVFGGSFIFCLGLMADALALSLYLRDESLSIHAYQVPLQDILRKLSQQGLEIKIDPQINVLVSANFTDRDLQQAIGSIVKPLNYVLIWKTISGPVGPITRLSEIQVFEPGRKEMMESLIKNPNLDVEVDPIDGGLYVKDEVLLTLGPDMTVGALKALLHQLNGTVIDSYPELGIYRIRLAENSDVRARVEQIRERDGVAKAEPNYVYRISAPAKHISSWQPVQDLVDSPRNPGRVPIAILDTGWNPDYGQSISVKASLDAFFPEQSISDPLGHGTQMVMLAAGMIKPEGVEMGQEGHNPVIPIRAFDENGYTSNFHVMKSIDFALKNGARVISLSWGSEIKSHFLEYQLNLAGARGAVIVAAAGNEPTGTPVYPAAYGSVLGIGALAPDGKPWEKSNFGDSVVVYAPGYASFPVGFKGEPGTYAGTSISTAFMAGLLADYLSRNPEATRQELFRFLNQR